MEHNTKNHKNNTNGKKKSKSYYQIWNMAILRSLFRMERSFRLIRQRNIEYRLRKILYYCVKIRYNRIKKTGAFLLVLIVFLKLLQKARIAEENAKKSQLQAEQANAFEEDRKMALSKGMNGHIAKLIDVKNMEEVLMSVLR